MKRALAKKQTMEMNWSGRLTRQELGAVESDPVERRVRELVDTEKVE